MKGHALLKQLFLFISQNNAQTMRFFYYFCCKFVGLIFLGLNKT